MEEVKEKPKRGPKAKNPANRHKKFIKFQLQNDGFNKAKVKRKQDFNDGRTKTVFDDEGRMTIYLEKVLRDNVTLTPEQASVINQQAVNSRIIYLESESEKTFDSPYGIKMFNIVNEIAK
jgi:beta-galactosidase beta subunit